MVVPWTAGYQKCEEVVIQQCRELLAKRLEYTEEDGESFLNAAQNARLIESAERYYRIMYYGGAESWNLRDTHMFETLGHVLDAHGPKSKAIVWAHNSHIGDARYTEMGVMREEVNIGQLCRARFGDAAALIGFGTHTGTVACSVRLGSRDGDQARASVASRKLRTTLPRFQSAALPARPEAGRNPPKAAVGAAARTFHRRYLSTRHRTDESLRGGVATRRRRYAEASLPQQFDAFVWFDDSSAITPLGPEYAKEGDVPDTYPFGL